MPPLEMADDSVRRNMYYQKVLKRHIGGITKRIYMAKKNKPIKSDCIELLKDDLEKKKNLTLEDEEDIENLSKENFKDVVKKAVRVKTFEERELIISNHSKVKKIQQSYMKEPQGCMKSEKFTKKLASILFNLRCRSENEFKLNFTNSQIQQLCFMCKSDTDAQDHALSLECTTPDTFLSKV